MDINTRIGMVGAGTMGAGIAQLAATAGHPVALVDLSRDALDRASSSMQETFKRLVEKGRMDNARAESILARIQFADSMGVMKGAGLAIEAIVERLDSKSVVLRALEDTLDENAVIATNTSSLSIAALGATLSHPERFLGLHFFNPAPVMQLVEVIPGVATEGRAVGAARALMETWGKSPVLAKDTPGFIVNRVARPYYSEALRIYDEGMADIATIDWAMREIGRFRMGPFELMDFIGHDVNYVVTRTVWEAMYYDPRFKPSLTQLRLLEAGRLGRKSGQGFYDYRPGAVAPLPHEDRLQGERIFERILSMIVNEAADAVLYGVSTVDGIDAAMTLGVNYPRGPLAWADDLGVKRIVAVLDGLMNEYDEDRYRVSPVLRRLSGSGGRFKELRSRA
ncbi:MAG: 3-hydroxyacyl-CoA dehydrogenase NAD-binding domain-containing protein [Acidobacteriota bacterium]